MKHIISEPCYKPQCHSSIRATTNTFTLLIIKFLFGTNFQFHSKFFIFKWSVPTHGANQYTELHAPTKNFGEQKRMSAGCFSSWHQPILMATECPTIQLNSDTNSMFASDSTVLRAQSHKMWPHSRYRSQLLSPQITYTSIQHGYKVRDAHNLFL